MIGKKVGLLLTFLHGTGCRWLTVDLSFQVAEKILDGRELEFYKWDGDLSQLLQGVREKINAVASVGVSSPCDIFYRLKVIPMAVLC